MVSKEEQDQLAEHLSAVAQGDGAAFRKIYSATADTLMAVCLMLVPSRDGAEDILQSAYLKIWRSAGTFDRQLASPMTWMVSITRNTAIDWRRKRTPAGNAQALDTMASDAEPTESSLIRQEEESEALSLVSDLDGETERYVRTIYLQGMTYREAAARDGVPIGTLKSKVRRALISIRERLRDD